MEFCSPAARKWFAAFIFLPWCFAYDGLAAISYWTRDWRKLQIIISIPFLLSALLFLVLPESPRWLLSQNRIAEAEAVIKRAAKFNRVQLPEDFHLDPMETPQVATAAVAARIYKYQEYDTPRKFRGKNYGAIFEAFCP